MNTKYLPVSWEQYHSLALNMAATMLSHEKIAFDEIVAIGRGGLSVGLILSDLLRIPIFSFTIQSYSDIKKQGELKVTEKLGIIIQNKRVLLVDDNADSGKTFIRALSYLKQFHPKTVTTASVYYKPWSTYRPDYFAKQTKKWILFPHEVTEWVYTFTQKMEKEGKTKREIQQFLTNLGYTEDQIKFVRKHHLQ